jgi:hypothetical protein
MLRRPGVRLSVCLCRCDPSAQRARGMLPGLAFIEGQIRALVHIFLAAGKPPVHRGLRGPAGKGAEDRLTVIQPSVRPGLAGTQHHEPGLSGTPVAAGAATRWALSPYPDAASRPA